MQIMLTRNGIFFHIINYKHSQIALNVLLLEHALSALALI